MKSPVTKIALGDALALLIITLIGFATHAELGLSFLPRLAAVFLPLIISWYLLAPWFGLFKQEIVRNPRPLWRVAVAALFAAPLAVVVRGVLLDMPVIPIFAVVLGVSSAVGLLIWRSLYSIIESRKPVT